MKRWNRVAALSLAMATAGGAGLARGESNLLIVLDASNSMWGQIDGTAKIDIAKEVLTDLLADMPEGVTPGLMVYGHRRQGDCADVELVAPLGAADSRGLIAGIEGLTPRGKTPIAAALRQAWEAFDGREEERNGLVLISDGIETCDADPCAVAQELMQRGIDVRIHAVGFDVDAEAAAQLECIAEAGDGLFLTAANAGALREAVQVAQATVVATDAAPAPAPEPAPAAGPARVFFDDFEGGALSDVWGVVNADPNAFIVEASALLVANSRIGGPGVGGTSNLFYLDEPLPQGDWDAYITLTAEMKTGRDAIWFGLWGDAQNHIGATMYTISRWCNPRVSLGIIRASGGEIARFDNNLGYDGCGDQFQAQYEAALEGFANEPFRLGVHKRGRSYHATLTTPEAGTVLETDRLTSLRPPGGLSITVGKSEDVPGEVLVLIGSIEILSVE